MPDELRDYLAAMHERRRERNRPCAPSSTRVAACLNGIDIVPVALKGAIRLIDGLWPDPALRFMHDLDLLVPEDALSRLRGDSSCARGWARSPGRDRTTAQHLSSCVHPGCRGRIELHRQPLPAPYAQLLPAARMLARARP